MKTIAFLALAATTYFGAFTGTETTRDTIENRAAQIEAQIRKAG